MTTKTITGLYDNYSQAAQTVRDFEAAQISNIDISIVAYSSDAHAVPSDSTHGAGAGTGASIGGGAGLLAGLGMLAIPGVGPVVGAGWLTATAVGAVSGVATGGLIARLTSAGVSKEHANFCAEATRRGGALVIVRVNKGLSATAAGAIMQRHGRIDPATRERTYRDGGWREFDEKSVPYTPADVARERALHSKRP